MFNYTLDCLPHRAAEAHKASNWYITDLLNRYGRARYARASRGIKEIAICGYGRSGKDTAAEYLCTKLAMVPPVGTSRIVLPIIAHMIGDSNLERVFSQRHQHRKFWLEACHAIRGEDYDLLVRMSLGAGDIVAGIRGGLELQAAKDKGVVETVFWINNNRQPVDPTVEYAESDCHFSVANHGTLAEFYQALDAIVPQLRRPLS